MSCLIKLDAYDPETGKLRVVVETPRGSRNKYKYDPALRVFRAHSLLPAGAVFPFDFGFVPATLGEDGDPLDVLLLMEEPAPGGFLVCANLIGVIEAEQTEDETTKRNDRLVAVGCQSHHHQTIRSLSELDEKLLDEIEHFFISYNEMQGKQFKPIGRRGPRRAQRIVADGQKRFQKSSPKS